MLDAVAYSSDANIQCKFCGKIFGLTRFGSFIYKILEGGLVLLSIFCSFYLYSTWPLVFSILVILLIRAIILPQFTRKVKNNPSWRISK